MDNPTSKTYLLRFGEMALKGRNRDRFVDDLVKIIKPRVAAIDGKIEKRYKKLLLHSPAPQEAVREALSTVFGITGISPLTITSHDPEAIFETARTMLAPHSGSGKTFAVRGRRALKSFPMKTPQLERYLGDRLLSSGIDLKVKLNQPELTLGVAIELKKTWLWLETWPGLGGLPVSHYVKHGLLLSGGIDSPVAGNLIQKRGGSIDAIYFDTPPFTVAAAHDKVVDLAHVLARYQNALSLHTVNFTATMKAIRAECDPRYIVVISRRFMMRTACAIMARVGGNSLITGECLGQVASQTIENMAAINEGVPLPILRPLVGMDKLEIITKAKQMGTFDISVQPFEDCCSLFSPKNPVTKASLNLIHRQEAKLPVDQLVEEALEQTETMKITPKWT